MLLFSTGSCSLSTVRPDVLFSAVSKLDPEAAAEPSCPASRLGAGSNEEGETATGCPCFSSHSMAGARPWPRLREGMLLVAQAAPGV